MPRITQRTLLQEDAGPAGAGPASATNWPDRDEWRYARLTTSPRDLPSYTHEQAQKISEHLYRANPLAHRILELTRDFVVGGGMTFQAEDKGIQKVLMEFWSHPRNNWPSKFPQQILEYYIYGEQLWRADVDKTGRVFTIAIPPLDIKDVVPDPRNPGEASKIVLVQDSLFGKSRGRGRPRNELDVVRLDLNPKSETYEYRIGDVFFFKNNPITGAFRGYPELLALSDLLDAYDDFGFMRIDRARLLMTYFWDITLEDYTQEEIDVWMAENWLLRPTQIGSAFGHNQGVTLKPVVPNLQARDASAESQETRRVISAGAGYPMTYLGGGDVGRTAESMAVEPTYRTLQQKQDEVRSMMSELFNFVIDQAMIHGLNGVNKGTNREFTISLPRVALRDVMRIGGALFRISQSLETATMQGWITPERAARVFEGLTEDLAVQLPERQEETEESLWQDVVMVRAAVRDTAQVLGEAQEKGWLVGDKAGELFSSTMESLIARLSREEK